MAEKTDRNVIISNEVLKVLFLLCSAVVIATQYLPLFSSLNSFQIEK